MLIQLADDDVHVWCLKSTASEKATLLASSLLSRDERDRAERYRFEHLKKSFTMSRGILRLLLGAYLGESPAKLRFGYSSKGKPTLRLPSTELTFNVSHSGELTLYAVTRGCEVGVDIEQISPVFDCIPIAESFFCSDECMDLSRVNFAHLRPAFFRCWTRKEAYTKATGEGICVSLKDFRVSLLPDEKPAILSIGGSTLSADAWSMVHLQPALGYIGALAIHGRKQNVRVLPVVSDRLAMSLLCGLPL